MSADRSRGTGAGGFDLGHALAVANRFEYGTDEWLTALLHDALEDKAITMGELAWFRHIGQAVLALTRTPGEQYRLYIARVAENDLATRVKCADLKTNLARLDDEHESLRPRYESALERLEARLSEGEGMAAAGPPAGAVTPAAPSESCTEPCCRPQAETVTFHVGFLRKVDNLIRCLIWDDLGHVHGRPVQVSTWTAYYPCATCGDRWPWTRRCPSEARLSAANDHDH